MTAQLKKALRDHHIAGLKTRPARALIGWMPQQEAQVFLSLPPTPPAPQAKLAKRIREAHAAVRARAGGVDQEGALREPTEELRGYLDEFREHPNCKPYLAGGCTFKIANLNQICALQPIAHSDYLDRSELPRDLAEDARQDDMLSLARITLPLHLPGELPVQFDSGKNAWKVRTKNPGARTMGHFRARVELAPGLFAMGFGFCVALLPSFVQVVGYRGRYFLKDGYHRSLAFLQNGIARVPVILQEHSEAQKLEVEGRFSDEKLLGLHPPLLSDYLRDDVAASGFHLVAEKNITIHASENLKWG
jgi:hypothetical protein